MRIKLLFLLTLIGFTLGQPGPPAQTNPPQNMDAIRIWKLTEVLELTEEQTITFLPLVQIHERKLRAAQHEIQKLTKQGYQLMKQDDLSQQDVNKLIKRYAAKQETIFQIKEEFIKSLPQYLTPKQQLLYLGFEARFRKELRTYMKDRRGYRNPQRRTERP